MISFLFFICIAIGSSFSAGEGNKASLNFNEIFNNEIKDMKDYLESESEKIKAKASTLKQDKKNFFKIRKFIAPLIGVFAVSCLAQKKSMRCFLEKGPNLFFSY